MIVKCQKCNKVMYERPPYGGLYDKFTDTVVYDECIECQVIAILERMINNTQC